MPIKVPFSLWLRCKVAEKRCDGDVWIASTGCVVSSKRDTSPEHAKKVTLAATSNNHIKTQRRPDKNRFSEKPEKQTFKRIHSQHRERGLLPRNLQCDNNHGRATTASTIESEPRKRLTMTQSYNNQPLRPHEI